VTDSALPASPDLDIPTAPTLAEVAIPVAPELNALVFDAEMPTADLTPPEPMFVYNEATYDSDVADALRTKLYNDITYGGTGLAEDVEQAIFDRASDRLEYELSKNYSAELTNFEAWGFEVPDGVLAANLREVLAEGTRRRAELNRDILVKQAELAQQNTQFAITSGLVHEKQLMDFTNQIANRAFEVARTTYQATIDIFKVRVDAFNARLEGYKAQAVVFEARVRAELARVEIYRAQMEGAKLSGDLNMQKVELYARRISALQTLVELYKARMEGARIIAEIDRVKLDGFRAVLDAKKAQIDAVTAKYNLYQAQLSGEKVKADIYGTQVDAYSKQVAAKKTEADIKLASLQAQIEANKEKVSVLQAAIEKYRADSNYQTSREEVNARAYTAQVGVYEADSRREQGYVASLVDEFRARVVETTAKGELLLKQADANLRSALALKELQVEALKSGANISAQKIASALASVSASAQLGYNESVSNAFTGSRVVGHSYNSSVNHSKDYTD
jgi:hypothetical protein